MDDYETHDDRRLLPGTGFTIEPGVYFERLRRPDGNQHGRRARRRDGHRTAADRDPRTRLVRRLRTMSTRKTTAFYALLLVVASLFVGMVIASRLDLTPASSAQTIAVPPMNSAPLTGAARRPDVPQHRQVGDADGRQYPDRDEGEGAGPHRLLRRRWRRRARRSVPPLLRQPAASRTTTRRQAPRGRGNGAPAAAGTDDACGRHRVHHQQGRLHPHQQPRRRRRDQDRSVALRRRSRRQLQGQGDRPRSADRQRADSTDRQAEPRRCRKPSSAIRRRSKPATG